MKSSNTPIIHFTGAETALMLSAIKLYMKQASPKKQSYYHTELSMLFCQSNTKNKVIHFDLNMQNAPIILHALQSFQHTDTLEQFLSTNEIKALKHAMNKIQAYYTTNKALQITPKQLLEQLDHDERLAKHDFIKEALSDIFSGLDLDTKSRQARYTTVLSALASTLVSNNSYDKTKHSNKEFFVINLTIAGLINELHNHKDSPSAHHQARVLLNHFKILRDKHYQFCTITTKLVDDTPYKLVFAPVHLYDCLTLIHMMKDLIKTKK